MLLNMLLYSYIICFLSLQKDVPPPPTYDGNMNEDIAKQVVDIFSVWKPNHKQNLWELSGQYEGDIMVNNENELKNVLLDESTRWLDGIVPYYIDKEFDEYEVKTIKGAVKEIEDNSCLIIRPYEKEDRDYVVIKKNKPGCWSYTGRQGGGQVINLSPKCVRHGIAVHEFLHALGVFHQQSASDRDKFITIHWENIEERAKNNFRKYETSYISDFGTGYDYNSIMHYGKYAFSKNDNPSITPNDKNAKIGQRKRLSEKDIKKLNLMYNCKCNTSQTTTPVPDNKGGEEEDEYEDNIFYDIMS